MILAGDKSGHPWHGVWSAATGKITTPAAAQIDLPGDAPSGVIVENELVMPPGDAILVKVPDQPAVTTTTEEAAAGKTWLNYGVISGIKHRIAGKNLGRQSWLYVAPDKSVWKATLAYSPLSGAVQVGFIRFGDFTPGAAAGEVTKTASHGYGMGSVSYWMIDDVSSTGNAALVTIFEKPVETIYNVLGSGVRDCRGGILVSLSGNPPDVTLTVTVMVLPEDRYSYGLNGSQTHHYVWYRSSDSDKPNRVDEIEDGGTVTSDPFVGSSPPEPPDQGGGLVWRGGADMTSYSETHTSAWFIGLAFSGTGSPEIVKLVTEKSLSFSGSASWKTNINPILPNDYHEYVADLSGTETQTWNGGVVVGETAIITLSGSCYVTSSFNSGGYGSGDDSLEISASWNFAGIEGSDTLSVGQFQALSPVVDLFGGGDVLGLYNKFSADADYTDLWIPIRYGNGLYGLMRGRVNTGAAEFSECEYVNVASVRGSSTAAVAATNLGQHFATCHPVTGQITRSTTPVCVV